MRERNHRSGHRCPHAVHGCGAPRLWRIFGQSKHWFCSRTCELIYTSGKRALTDREVEELTGLLEVDFAEVPV